VPLLLLCRRCCRPAMAKLLPLAATVLLLLLMLLLLLLPASLFRFLDFACVPPLSFGYVILRYFAMEYCHCHIEVFSSCHMRQPVSVSVPVPVSGCSRAPSLSPAPPVSLPPLEECQIISRKEYCAAYLPPPLLLPKVISISPGWLTPRPLSFRF